MVDYKSSLITPLQCLQSKKLMSHSVFIINFIFVFISKKEEKERIE